MENKKNVVALSDDLLETVGGGLYLDDQKCVNQVTGETYSLLVDKNLIFATIVSFGPIPDDQRIAKLLQLGYIG